MFYYNFVPYIIDGVYAVCVCERWTTNNVDLGAMIEVPYVEDRLGRPKAHGFSRLLPHNGVFSVSRLVTGFCLFVH